MVTRTPPEITQKVRLLAAKVAPREAPVYVSIAPEAGALLNECFHNTESKVQRDGGSVLFGWQLWEWPNVLLEAEFHAVWCAPDGKLIDVTPKVSNDDKILFVTDKKLAYNGISVDNVRIALRDDLLIHHLILLLEQIFDVTNRGERKYRTGAINLPANEIEPLLLHVEIIQGMLRQGLRPHDNCLCGSGRKYKRCHGRLIT